MKTKIFFAALLTMATLNLSSCATAPENTADSRLNHSDWILSRLNGKAVLPEPLITLTVEDDKMIGSDGCNRYQAYFSSNAKQFSVSKNIAHTMMACPPPISDQASAYMSALTETAIYEIDDKQLTLRNVSGKKLAIFSKQNTELSGTSWQVNSINNGKQAVVSTIIDSKLTVNFDANGIITGTAGCNNYSARYKVTGKKIRISGVSSTRKMCAKPEGIMQQEAEFLKALESASITEFDGKKLDLRTDTNALAVSLVETK